MFRKPLLHTQIYTDALPAFSGAQSLAAFALASKLYTERLQPALHKMKLQKLLNHVIRGEQAEAEQLLRSSPTKDLTVLLKRGKVTDYSNRTIEGTAFQLALGAEDVKFHENEECMAEMLARYIRMLPNGEATLAEQYHEQFPDGLEDPVRVKQDADALDHLLKVIHEITEEDCKAANAVDDKIQALLREKEPKNYDPLELKKINDAVLNATQDDFDEAFHTLKTYLSKNGCLQTEPYYVDMLTPLKALYQFRNYLESSTHVVIKNGKHFNAQLLAKAFELYDKNYESFGGAWKSAKNLLCWRKVIGYTQRFLPACYAQAFSRDIYHLVRRGKELERSLKFVDLDGSFFPLVPNSAFSLGYDFAGGGGGVVCCTGGWRSDAPKTYIEQK